MIKEGKHFCSSGGYRFGSEEDASARFYLYLKPKLVGSRVDEYLIFFGALCQLKPTPKP
jgi:hypothetical protein